MQAIELIQRFIDVSRERLEAITTAKAAWGFVSGFVMDAVERLKSIDSMTGLEKYDLVMTAVGWLFDYFIGTITLPWYLRWLIRLANPSVRAAVLAAADRLLEAFYARIK